MHPNKRVTELYSTEQNRGTQEKSQNQEVDMYPGTVEV